MAPRKMLWRPSAPPDKDDSNTELGSIGIVFKGNSRNLWRFYDERRQPIELAQARRRM